MKVHILFEDCVLIWCGERTMSRMDESIVRQIEKGMARWGGLSSLQDQ